MCRDESGFQPLMVSVSPLWIGFAAFYEDEKSFMAIYQCVLH